MPNRYLISPLKSGFLIVTLAYFLFTLHGMLTLAWIGEWDAFGGSLRLIIVVEDVSAYIGVFFRFIASTIALGGIVFYFVKKGLPTFTVKKLVRLVFFGEAIYWLGLLPTAILTLTSTTGFTIWRANGHISTLPIWTSILIYAVPLLIESIVIPIVLFKLFHEMSPNRLWKGAIKWGWIAGVVYLFVFWLTSTTIWVSTILRQGIQYVTAYHENLVSFTLTVFGLLALTIVTAHFSKKYSRRENADNLDIRAIGAVITILGLIYLWNYLTWIFFGKDETWSYWYLWFLGNLNLWLLTVPMVGLPLLFGHKCKQNKRNY